MQGVHVLRDDLLRGFGRYLFDVHATLGGGHDGDAARLAIDDEGQVELPFDVEPLLDI
jgi:hypothetical protein